MTQAMLRPLPERASAPALDDAPPAIGGKFFFVGDHKLYLRGVSYGPFAVSGHGFPFPDPPTLETDFRLMAELGVNCLRTFTVPPRWVLDRAAEHGLRVLITIPWAEHVCFLDDKALVAEIRAGFESGAAGTFVFSWTDDWFTGGAQIADWAFGLVDAQRRPKPAYHAVQAQYAGPLPPRLERTPCVSVVVCAYNAGRTMDACLESLRTLNYPDYEVIVVNDGSTDATLAISERHKAVYDADPGGPRMVIISQENKGLSVARNVGAHAASGEIVAYTDSDCVPDPDWLAFLVFKFVRSGFVAVGGPNFPPPEPHLVPAAVAASPGGPTHVLLNDEVAEHVPGCNMAFTKKALEEIGGFEPVFAAAGDDVDLCWRLQNRGYPRGFSPAATVWHYRRNTVKAYLKQQMGYGKAEALLYFTHPYRFNLLGQSRWLGRIYGELTTGVLSRRPIIYFA